MAVSANAEFISATALDPAAGIGSTELNVHYSTYDPLSGSYQSSTTFAKEQLSFNHSYGVGVNEINYVMDIFEC